MGGNVQRDVEKLHWRAFWREQWKHPRLSADKYSRDGWEDILILIKYIFPHFHLLLRDKHHQSVTFTWGLCLGRQSVSHIAGMSAQGLLNSVFSCSSSGSKTLAKRKLQQTRSLDSALMRNGATPGDANTVQRFSSSTAGFTNSQTASEDSRLKQRLSSSSLSTSSDASSISSAHFDYRSGKRNASRDLSLNLSGSSNIFSPRKWLQRKLPQSDAVSHNICKSEVRYWKHAEEFKRAVVDL